MRVGQNRKRDANETDIVNALERLGWHVDRLSGKGLPDILCRKGDRVLAFEVKSKAGKRTEAQHESQWPILRSIEDALAAVGMSTPGWEGR